MGVAEWKGAELTEASHSEPAVFTEKWTDVELKCTYHLEPEEEGTHFLCGEKMQQMPRGRWIQQVAMTRNGNQYSRTGNVV
eukprot:1627374-Pyramimonas_sp.AAC.1